MSDKKPTPLERLEAWRTSGPRRDYNIFTDYKRTKYRYAVELWVANCEVVYAHAPTIDAAILAALARAEGGTHE